MGLIWNLLSLVKSAQHAAGSFQEMRGRAAHCQRALHQFQDTLVQKDYERAQAGNRQAQFDMGERFYQGLGVTQDYNQAAVWFQEAAQRGHGDAQRVLAVMYFLGRGVGADPAEAYKWAILASSTGEQEALNIRQKIRAKIPAEAATEGEQRASRMAVKPSGRE
jgi:TPR repeat protein